MFGLYSLFVGKPTQDDLALSKQAVHITGHEVATDYSRYLGVLLVQLDIANEKNAALWVFLLQAGLTALLIPSLWARLYVNTKKKELKLKSDEQLNCRLALNILEGTPFKYLLRESIQKYTPCIFSLNDRKAQLRNYHARPVKASAACA